MKKRFLAAILSAAMLFGQSLPLMAAQPGADEISIEIPEGDNDLDIATWEEDEDIDIATWEEDEDSDIATWEEEEDLIITTSQEDEGLIILTPQEDEDLIISASEEESYEALDEELSSANEEALDASKPKITVTKSKLTYNGKKQKPTFTIKYGKKTLKYKTHYTYKYKTDGKSVGTHKLTITYKKPYSGTATVSYTILPKGTSMADSTAKGTTITAKFKKQSIQITGYELNWSTKKNFSSKKSAKITNKNAASYTIKDLKAGTKYYLRIRTYKDKLYSAWSKVTSVTVPEAQQDNKSGLLPDDSPLYYYRGLLSGEKLDVYNSWLQAIRTPGQHVTFSSTLSKEDVFAIGKLCQGDHPELLYTDLYGDLSGTEGDANINYDIYAVNREAVNTYKTPEAVIAAVDKKMDPFYKDLAKQSTEYGKIKYIFEYIVNNVKYKETGNHQSVTGALLNGVAVCHGYSRAFQYLAQRAGFSCVDISGTVIINGKDGTHSKNAIKVADGWYVVDTTFGDSNGDENSGVINGAIKYVHLMEGDYEGDNSFTPDPDMKPFIPALNGKKLLQNEFSTHLVSPYSEAALKEELLKQYNAGAVNVCFKFSSQADYQAAYNWLITKKQYALATMNFKAIREYPKIGNSNKYNIIQITYNR